MIVKDRRFYEYQPDANSFAGVGFSTDDDDDDEITAIHWIDEPLAAAWRIRSCHGFSDNPVSVGDFPSVSNFNTIPMMSERAWNALEPIIGDCCEPLPVIHPFTGTYFIIHVMATIDALDTDASEVDRYSTGDRRIARIYRYAFKMDLIEKQHIFKLPLMCGSGLIIDDEVRKRVETNGLRGLQFQPLPMIGPI